MAWASQLIAGVDVAAQGLVAVVGDGQQGPAAVAGVGLAAEQAPGLQRGQHPGQRLGLDPLRGGQLARGHRASVVQLGQHGQLQQGDVVRGPFGRRRRPSWITPRRTAVAAVSAPWAVASSVAPVWWRVAGVARGR